MFLTVVFPLSITFFISLVLIEKIFHIVRILDLTVTQVLSVNLLFLLPSLAKAQF